MASPPTKCDIIRDFSAAAACGLCTGNPVNCPPGLPSALCGIPQAANNRMALFVDKYNPSNIFMSAADRAQLAQEERNYLSGIQSVETGIQAAYPNAPAGAASIGWPDLNYCLWNKTGTPGGPNNNKYFERNDAQNFGMNPAYPVGGTVAQGALWQPPKTSPLPLTVDYVMNPDLAVIALFAILVIIFAVLVYLSYQGKKRAPLLAEERRAAARRQLEAADPFRGTAFESYPDPQEKCRQYVEAMEARGFEMGYYRQQCGLPAKSG